MKTYYLYILECVNHSYYIGYTTDLQRRYQAHSEGRAAKYTRSFPPLRIAASWSIECTLSEIFQTESYLKKHTRATKSTWVDNPDSLVVAIRQWKSHLDMRVCQPASLK